MDIIRGLSFHLIREQEWKRGDQVGGYCDHPGRRYNSSPVQVGSSGSGEKWVELIALAEEK